MSAGPAILATGSALPPTVRGNDDPVFDWLHQHPVPGQDLFAGYDQRRVLAPGETLVELMAGAARGALGRAGVAAGDVDLLLGYASFGRWATPNDLVVVAAELGLPAGATILPLNGEFAIFNQGLVVADAMLRAGRATTALVVVGADWTRYVDYRTAQAISAGDGAGAAVLAASDAPGLWRLVDASVDSDRSYLGGMFTGGDETQPPKVPPTYGAPVFHLTELGVEAFKTFGVHGPPALARAIIERNGLTPAGVSFIGHQASSVLTEAWKAALQPGQYVETIATLANMTSATIPVDLDICEIGFDHVAMAALGPEPSSTVVLLSRAA